jgi:small-conductance mechanosensitive channel
VGDYIQIAGQAGVVRALNTRATVLVTLDGNQVRIPNAIIFKEILVNNSASSSVRGTFDVMIDHEASASVAMEAIGKVLAEHEALTKEPTPRALVEALEPAGVRLRAYYWLPATGVDGYKIHSDARLKAKVALQEAGIKLAPPTPATLVASPEALASARAGRSRQEAHEARQEAARRTEESRRQDAEAAARTDEGEQRDAAEHAMDVAQDRVGDEGQDLIKANGRSESSRD